MFSFASSALSGYLNYKSAKEMQRRQIEWERERAQNAHQWEVQDLRNAGLNPVLSAGGSGAVTGGISAPSGFFPDLGATFNSAKHADSKVRQTDINEKAVQSQTELNQATTAQQLTQAARNEADIRNQDRLTSAQIDLIKQQATNFMINSARTRNYLNIEQNPLFVAGYAGQHSKGVGGAVSSALAAAVANSAKSSKDFNYYGKGGTD